MTDAETQLESLFARYPVPVAGLGRSVRAKLRARLPGLSEVVYLYERQEALVISWSPTGQGYDGVISLGVYPDRVQLFFARGASLGKADPKKLLRGTAAVRHVVVEAAEDLDRPEIEALMVAALDLAGVRVEPGTEGAIVFRVESQKKRAERAKKGSAQG